MATYLLNRPEEFLKISTSDGYGDPRLFAYTGMIL